MEKLFNRLLVPFHLWEDADPAIREGIKMANQLQSDIYLLHFIKGAVRGNNEEEDPVSKAMRQHYQPLLTTLFP